MAQEFKLSYTASDINKRLGKIDSLADKSEVPTKTSELANDSGFATETYVQNYAQPVGDYALNSDIPEVPIQSVNGQTGDVNLSALDVGALPDTTFIPTKVSELANDFGFITDYTETDPTVPDWAKEPTKPSYTAEEVGALPNTTEIPTVPTNVSAFANDAGYLTEHQSLDGLATEDYVDEKISAISTSDVSAEINTHNIATDAHSDIRNLINAIVVPTKVSELDNDKNYLSAIPSEYVTETELSAKGYLTEHQSLAGYATESYVQSYVEEIILGGAW